jgi:hypothetical protein
VRVCVCSGLGRRPVCAASEFVSESSGEQLGYLLEPAASSA